MPRAARIMIEGCPFHITHRGNHRKAVFSSARDRRLYLDLLRHYSKKFEMAVWAYCLMPNHVHLIAVGTHKQSISKAIGLTHRDFSAKLHKAQDVTGHLWANRFFSTALDETHLWAAVRYVELNPVRGGLVRRAENYRWSSAACHSGIESDCLLAPERPFPGPIGDWSAWLETGLDDETAERMRVNTYTGHPTGSDRFVSELSQRLGRPAAPRKRRRRRRAGPV